MLLNSPALLNSLAGLVLLVLTFTATPVWAVAVPGVTLTFNDLSDFLTVTISDPARLLAPAGCSNESCMAILVPSSNANSLTGFTDVLIGDPSGLTVSDELELNGSTVLFTSDQEGASLGSCMTACTLFENGQIQIGGTISWFNQGTLVALDTIQFVSDTDAAVPEPSSLLLFLMALSLLLAPIIRRHRASRSG